MSRKAIDLTGRKFDRLTVIKRVENYIAPCGKVMTQWLCQCDCENKTLKIVTKNNLLSGGTKSCGCYKEEHPNGLKHGKSRSRIYDAWKHMINRCYNPNDKAYKNYGERGIVVCQEWLGGLGIVKFEEWALSNGYSDNLTIDRKNVNGNYEPSNCRWVTRKEQNNNKRDNRVIVYNGKAQTLAQWAVEKGLKYTTLKRRIYKSWSIEKALTTPVKV